MTTTNEPCSDCSARDAEIARLRGQVAVLDGSMKTAMHRIKQLTEIRPTHPVDEQMMDALRFNQDRVAQLEAALRTYLAAIDSMTHDGVPPDAAVVARRELRALLDTR